MAEPDKKQASGYESPSVRGAMDAYYGRNARPHKFLSLTEEVKVDDLTDEEISEYFTGFMNEEDRKDWS